MGRGLAKGENSRFAAARQHLLLYIQSAQLEMGLLELLVTGFAMNVWIGKNDLSRR